MGNLAPCEAIPISAANLNLPQHMHRRQFTSTAALAALTAAHATAQTGAGEARTERAGKDKPIRIGNTGCGGRGSFVADIIKENPGFVLAAAHDYFPDRAANFGAKFGIAAENLFSGLDGYKKMLDQVDAIAIHSPPFFHVQQAIDAVAAGKHVLIAKPVAIDVAGCEIIRKLAKDAAAKGIAVYADVQSRGDEFFQEGIRRVQTGGIGDLTFGECHYEADLIPLQAPASDSPENRLKNWIRHRDLGGDIITEQNIHALDIVSWAFGRPTQVSGISGRAARPDAVGDVADHFSLLFEFAKGAVSFGSRQYNAWGSQFQCESRFVGTKGVFTCKFGGRVMIRGNKENTWPGGESKDLYKSGSVKNLEAFRKAILAGDPQGNATIDPSVETVLLTLFGEYAAKAPKTVTWEEFIANAKPAQPDLNGLKA